MTDYNSLIPINVITGFLGSGKTSLLKRLLRSPGMRDTAVLINEFGEVGLDHHLIEHATENTLLLENGCLCCAIRGDLQASLRDLFSRRESGEIPPFRRVVIETSGLADPVPIAYTLLSDPVIQHHFRLGNVVTVVDAVNGVRQLEQFPQSVKQVAIADRIVLSKTDLCPPEAGAALDAALRGLNLSAPVVDLAEAAPSADALLVEDIYTSDGKHKEIERWLAGSADPNPGRDHVPHHHHHEDGIYSFCLTFDTPLDWTAFGIWLTMLLNQHGERVLRVKGMLNVEGVADPVLINGVQHIVHPPTHLDGWPDADRRSRIVFIVRGIDRARIERSLATFNGLSNPGTGQAIIRGGTAAAADTHELQS